MKRLLCITVIVFSVVGLMSGSPAFAEDEDVAEVRAAAEQFYSALNVMFTGELRPMKEIWSHEDDVMYMGPGGGFQMGWQAVLAEWEAQAALKLGGQVEPEDMRITVGRDLAIVGNYEIGHNVTPDGRTQEVTIRATNLFRHENGKWRMIGHHTDLLPFLEKSTAGLRSEDNVKVVYHIKVGALRPDGVAKGVAELRHLLRIYDEQDVTRDKRDIHAVFDADGVPFVLNDEAYSRFGEGDTNPNAPLIAELIEEGVAVEVCGQRMARDKLTAGALLPGVTMVLAGQARVIELELLGYAYFRF